MINLEVGGAMEFSISPDKLLRGDGRVVAAEAEGVVHDGVDRHFARCVGHVIQIARRIRSGVIDGRRHNAPLDRQRAHGHFHRARRPEHVTGCAFG